MVKRKFKKILDLLKPGVKIKWHTWDPQYYMTVNEVKKLDPPLIEPLYHLRVLYKISGVDTKNDKKDIYIYDSSDLISRVIILEDDKERFV